MDTATLRKEGEDMNQDVARRKTMNDDAREARNAYKREWYAKNKDKQREYERRYWKRKADSDRKKTEENGRDGEQL